MERLEHEVHGLILRVLFRFIKDPPRDSNHELGIVVNNFNFNTPSTYV
jgi:hypothetical protein